MRRDRFVGCVCLAGLSLGLAGACNLGGLVPEQEVPFNLDNNVGSFDVVAGESVQKTGVLTFDPNGITIGRGSMEIDPDAITITETGGSGKIRPRQGGSTTQTLIITARVDAPEDVETVCSSTDEYGPYEVELDANLNIVSVTPPSITLSETTIALLNTGSLSLCLEVEAPVSGNVRIERLLFNLGL